jgi:hypothetical protein
MAVICFGTIRGYILGIRNHLKLQMWGWNLGIKPAAKNENPVKLRGAQFLLAFVFLGHMAARASNLDTIGVTLLQTVTTNVNGAGIRVAQPEAGYETATNWQVNPSASGIGQPVSLFTYYSTSGSANNFPNAVGAESSHADAVAGNFYGMSGGVATNVTHVDNYEANYFINNIVNTGTSIPARVVNQSFTYGTYNTNIDQICDNYAARYNTLFVSGAGFNGSPVYTPATCYNGIGVGVSDNSNTPYGPTPDGRSKPDIIAPGTLPDPSVTSYTTPQVAGAAALLMQAGLRGDGGSDTNSTADIRTVKALLLNGAVKPADWTNGAASPLDARYGAGVLNVFNSYKQLAGRKQTNFVPASVSAGAPHPPTGATNTIGVLSGWNFTNLTSSSSLDAVAHYYFNVTNGVSNATFTATATLVWNRHQNKSSINNLQLFLYNAANSNLVAVCTSAVDNVQHLYVPKLPQGRYDLQVLKKGGSYVSASETYALAFEFFSLPLNIVKSGTNVALKWPIYPTGFVVKSTTNLASPVVWNSLSNLVTTVTNNQNYVVLNVTNRNQFFRLQRP